MPAPTTIACRDEDFADWHGGCRRGAVWAVDVDTAEVRAAVEAVREHWGDLLLPRYERQPHITVAYCGPVAEPGCTPADVAYTPERFHADLAALRGDARSPFRVEVGGWGTFPMVPYLRAEAPELRALNEALAGTDDYTPHVTAGHYAVARPLAAVMARAAPWTAPAPVSFDVAELCLMTYDTSDIAGPLRVEGRYSLADGSWVGSQFRHTGTHAFLYGGF